MKRVRDDSNNNIEEEERCPTNRNFRTINQENTCSNTNNIINPSNNIINNVVNTKISSSTSSSSAIAINNNNENKEQDRFLPIANVGRIMKNVIPGNGKISKDAKETVQECVSEFISFVTGEASEKCQREKRKTINGDDILWAIMTLGFEDYVNPLKLYLTKYREIEGEKLNNVPKQQRLEQQQQQHSNPNPNPNPNPNFSNSLYGISQPQYPFSQNSQQDNFHRHW